MFGAVLSLALASAPVTVAVPGATCVGMQQQLCDSFLERFITNFAQSGRVKVIASNDIAQLLGLERQRQLLGCAEDSTSCTAELVQALGADALLMMRFTRSAPYFVVTARLVRSKTGAMWASGTERVEQEGQLFDAVDTLAEKFAGAAAGPVPLTPARRVVPWVPAAVGVIAAVIGGVVFASASTERKQLLSGMAGSREDALIAQGRMKEGVGVGLFVTGGVGLAASLIWALVGLSDSPVALVTTRHGLGLALSGRWP